MSKVEELVKKLRLKYQPDSGGTLSDEGACFDECACELEAALQADAEADAALVREIDAMLAAGLGRMPSIASFLRDLRARLAKEKP
jgi:FMN phosphatase YigB (HAD superfamily)